MEEGIREAIRECCQNMLYPPIKNIGLAGIEKWADLIIKWPQQFKGINLYGTLSNGFMYIEISGTAGSGFRTMYARFLDESSSIINEPALQEVAEMMRQSAKVWSEIAAGLMPDSWPTPGRARGLMLQKNAVFEEQEPGALEAMLKINRELDELMTPAIGDLQKPPDFLGDVRRDILRCREVERKAFETLSHIVG